MAGTNPILCWRVIGTSLHFFEVDDTVGNGELAANKRSISLPLGHRSDTTNAEIVGFPNNAQVHPHVQIGCRRMQSPRQLQNRRPNPYRNRLSFQRVNDPLHTLPTPDSQAPAPAENSSIDSNNNNNNNNNSNTNNNTTSNNNNNNNNSNISSSSNNNNNNNNNNDSPSHPPRLVDSPHTSGDDDIEGEAGTPFECSRESGYRWPETGRFDGDVAGEANAAGLTLDDSTQNDLERCTTATMPMEQEPSQEEEEEEREAAETQEQQQQQQQQQEMQHQHQQGQERNRRNNSSNSSNSNSNNNNSHGDNSNNNNSNNSNNSSSNNNNNNSNSNSNKPSSSGSSSTRSKQFCRGSCWGWSSEDEKVQSDWSRLTENGPAPATDALSLLFTANAGLKNSVHPVSCGCRTTDTPNDSRTVQVDALLGKITASQEDTNEHHRTLVVRNLWGKCSPEMLAMGLAGLGLADQVDEVYVPMRNSRKSGVWTNRGFGFITARRVEDLKAIIQFLHHRPVQFYGGQPRILCLGTARNRQPELESRVPRNLWKIADWHRPSNVFSI